jgi:hypothetical protein
MSDQLRGLSLVGWPVLIKYSDYEELGYVADASGWETEVGAGGAYLGAADILIDSRGASFSIVIQGDGFKVVTPAQETIAMDELLTWVRTHAALQGHCCVSKLYASSMGEVFSILQSLDD